VILRVFFSEEPMQRLGREQWIELIIEYKKSGLTQKEFAERHQVSHNAVQFWLYELRREADSAGA